MAVISPNDIKQASGTPFPPPQDLNDFIQRVIYLLRMVFGSTIIIVILSAIGVIIFLALAILKGL